MLRVQSYTQRSVAALLFAGFPPACDVLTGAFPAMPSIAELQALNGRVNAMSAAERKRAVVWLEGVIAEQERLGAEIAAWCEGRVSALS